MSRQRARAFRFVAVLGVMASVSLTAGLVGPADGPYLSALSDLAIATSVAAPRTCNFKACAKEPGRKTPDCHNTTQALNCSKSQATGCITSICS